jgi:SAM-dependent methyltransferase
MQTRESLARQLDDLRRQYGEWSTDIPLPFGLWTRASGQAPHTRLKRIVQIVQDLSGKPIAECRVLDLGCLEGLFAIELALKSATVVGVEIREGNFKKAEFSRQALGLENLTFIQQDVRKVSRETLGEFDVVICSGLLYHLPADDVFRLVESMHDMSRRLVIIDTHVSLRPVQRVAHAGREYLGHVYREHPEGASQSDKARSLWASWDNTKSFWFSRPSLVNMLMNASFSSVYECFASPWLEGELGMERGDRCTFVALKGQDVALHTVPAMTGQRYQWAERSLAYAERSAQQFLDDWRFHGSHLVGRVRALARSRFSR